MVRELINTCHGFLGVTGRDGGVLELMECIAIESMVWTASDTAYIKQCTCEGAQGAWGKCSCHVAQRLVPGSDMRSMQT